MSKKYFPYSEKYFLNAASAARFTSSSMASYRSSNVPPPLSEKIRPHLHRQSAGTTTESPILPQDSGSISRPWNRPSPFLLQTSEETRSASHPPAAALVPGRSFFPEERDVTSNDKSACFQIPSYHLLLASVLIEIISVSKIPVNNRQTNLLLFSSGFSIILLRHLNIHNQKEEISWLFI